MAEKAELTKRLSEYGLISLVELRIKYQSRFDNTSDTGDKVWEHVLRDYNALVGRGELPKSDELTLAGIKRHWSNELGSFRLWCDSANRAVTLSGVPTEQVRRRRRRACPVAALVLVNEHGAMRVGEWVGRGQDHVGGRVGGGGVRAHTPLLATHFVHRLTPRRSRMRCGRTGGQRPRYSTSTTTASGP